MNTTVDTMKVEKSLMNPDFEGYKLSLENIATFVKKLPESLKPHSPSDEQYSYTHGKVFAAHNVLLQDPFNEDIYLIGDRGNKIYRIEDKCDEGASADLVEVWNGPSFDDCPDPREDVYNANLTFPGSQYAVYSDGRGQLCIFDIKARDSWSIVFQGEICGPAKSFTNVSARLSDDGKILHILVQYVEEKSKVEDLDPSIFSPSNGDAAGPGSSNFLNIVEWIEFDCGNLNQAKKTETETQTQNAVSSKFERLRRYAFLGEIEYLELVQSGILCFGEDKSFQLLYDSEGLEKNGEAKVEEEKSSPPETPPPFYWLQGVEDMAVWVMLPKDIHKKEIKVSLKPSQMSIKIKNETVLDGKLWGVIDSDSMTWTIDTKKNKLEVTFCKANDNRNSGMIWQRFLADKELTDGEEVMHADMVEKIHQELSHLTTNDPNANSIKENSQVYNNQELESCDDNSTITRAYMYINDDDPTKPKKVNVGDRQVLFISTAAGLKERAGNGLRQLCLRHDVDGLVWQPVIEKNSGNADSGSGSGIRLEHVDTFDALGYVQASKSQRRFTMAAPDRSYAAIIDRQRHVYIYRKPEPIAEGCELRNRKSGQSVEKVAKQQVSTLDHDSEDFVVGAIATRKTVFVATCCNLYCLKIH